MSWEAGIGLEECARLLAGHSWWEGRLFSLSGAWASEAPDPQAKLWLAEQSRSHGRRAQMWRAMIPDTAVTDPDRLIGEAGSEFGAVGDALGATGAEALAARMAVLGRVALARLAAAYDAHLECSSELSDAAVMAELRRAIDETTRAWLGCERLVLRLVESPDGVESVLAQTRRLEVAYIEAGYPRRPWALCDEPGVPAGIG